MRLALFGPIVLSAIAVSPALAADRLSPIQLSAACAPLPASSLQDNAPRIIGVQDTVARTAYGRGDLIVIGAGLGRGLQLDQRYYVRRGPSVATRHAGASGPRGANTAGWVRIVAVNETTAIALVEFACDALLTGDLLQPYTDPVVPFDADRTDTAGEPDFSAAGRVLFGDNERTSAGAGEFLVTDLGDEEGLAAGGRFAIYRNLGIDGVPLAAIGEAIVVSVLPEFSVIRVTRSRDAVRAGDLLVPRRRP